jgi:small subunit ribosomal protein S5
VPLKGTTIPHEVIGRFGPSSVVLKPGAPGTGVIAGSVVRSVIEACGIRDIRTKCIGSTNANNVLHGVMEGLMNLQDVDGIASVLGKTPDEMGYSIAGQ